ncbi:MAG: hypothetical protein M1378_03895 [Bacteroidetes bacterium]|nr:hypothetical protein [Bacteroidota bacterium]
MRSDIQFPIDTDPKCSGAKTVADCSEPIAVLLGVALAEEILDYELEKIDFRAGSSPM